MNLHITHDDKFIDYFIALTNELNVSNDKFVVYTDHKVNQLKHVKSPEVLFAQSHSKELIEIIGPIKQYKNIYIHWLSGFAAEFVNSLPTDINIIWCFWGGDGLELPSMSENVYGTLSYKYFKNTERFQLKTLFSKTLIYRYRKKHYLRKQHLKAIKRINYFAHYLPEDYEIIKEHTGFIAKYIPFHYASAEALVAGIEYTTQTDSGNILLGNSDSLSNNHFEAILQLETMDIGNRKIFCPLSYEAGKYAHDAAAFGKLHLGARFVPLLTFVTKQEYNKMLAGITAAIMNHYRSQALGNIATLLFTGAKIYMNEKSTLFNHLIKHGFVIYSVQKDLNSENKNAFSPVTNEIMVQNKNALLKLFGKEKQLTEMKNLLTL